MTRSVTLMTLEDVRAFWRDVVDMWLFALVIVGGGTIVVVGSIAAIHLLGWWGLPAVIVLIVLGLPFFGCMAGKFLDR